MKTEEELKRVLVLVHAILQDPDFTREDRLTTKRVIDILYWSLGYPSQFEARISKLLPAIAYVSDEQIQEKLEELSKHWKVKPDEDGTETTTE